MSANAQTSQKSKVISLRLDSRQESFINNVRGNLLPGEAIKSIIDYASNFEGWSKNIILDVKRIGVPRNG